MYRHTSVSVFHRRVEWGIVPPPYHTHRVCCYDEWYGQKVHGVPVNAGQRPNDSNGPVVAVPPWCRLLPDGQNTQCDICSLLLVITCIDTFTSAFTLHTDGAVQNCCFQFTDWRFLSNHDMLISVPSSRWFKNIYSLHLVSLNYIDRVWKQISDPVLFKEKACGTWTEWNEPRAAHLQTNFSQDNFVTVGSEHFINKIFINAKCNDTSVLNRGYFL